MPLSATPVTRDIVAVLQLHFIIKHTGIAQYCVAWNYMSFLEGVVCVYGLGQAPVHVGEAV